MQRFMRACAKILTGPLAASLGFASGCGIENYDRSKDRNECEINVS